MKGLSLHLDQLSVGQLSVCSWPIWLSGPSLQSAESSGAAGELRFEESECEKQS